MSSKGKNRFYTAGRSTAGWKRGLRIRDHALLIDGVIFIRVSHKFQSENLAIVICQRALESAVRAKWVGVDGKSLEGEGFSVHPYMLQERDIRGIDAPEEYYFAIRDTESLIS